MPVSWAGTVTVSEVEELTTKASAGVSPKYTAVAPLRWVPVMVSWMPPDALSPEEPRLLMVGRSW